MNNFSIEYLTGKLYSKEANSIPTFATNQVQNLTKIFPEVSYDLNSTASHRSSPLSMSSSLSSPSSTSTSSSTLTSPESLSPSSSPSSSSTETNGIPFFNTKQVCNFTNIFPEVSYDYKSTASHRSTSSLISVPYTFLSPSSTSLSPSSTSSSNPSSPDSLSPSSSLSSSSTTTSEKPAHSYIALISMSILNSSEKKVLLGDIYQYVMDNFPYYNNKEKAWRNSIRHNLSLNECFIKSGRADNGKGNYWSIHPACIEDFSRGDFRRRQARRRARKNTMSEMSKRPMSYQYDMRYVPMTTSTLPFGSPLCYPQSHFTPNPMTQGLGYQSMAALPRAMASSVSYTMSTNQYQSYQSYLPGLQV
ncbi:hypothetical protein SNE40_005056 [Patella caerulea]|uniref:Fork-head domain-containing protein n=1 Tax=Patella caerulea TaxID=87958 RepID=A0AAN8Q1Q1_PATCE